MKKEKKTNYQKIKEMSIEELADFLIYSGEEECTDYDWDENVISIVEPCYYTPFNIFPGYFSVEEVRELVVNWLKKSDRKGG